MHSFRFKRSALGHGTVIAILMSCPLAAASSASQVVKVVAGTPLAGIVHLTSGTRRYARYIAKPGGERQLIDLWQRTISWEGLDGARKLHITQRWDSVRDSSQLIQDSWFEPTTFAPISHVRRLTKGGTTTVLGYRFVEGAVTGIPGLDGASDSDFRMVLPEATYNFEYDMELLEALPLAAGKTFDIPFYDAGIDKKPDRYRFVVAGADKVVEWDGKSVDCWLVTADYGTGQVLNRFWITQRSHLLVREEGARADGSVLIKALLPPEP